MTFGQNSFHFLEFVKFSNVFASWQAPGINYQRKLDIQFWNYSKFIQEPPAGNIRLPNRESKRAVNFKLCLWLVANMCDEYGKIFKQTSGRNFSRLSSLSSFISVAKTGKRGEYWISLPVYPNSHREEGNAHHTLQFVNNCHRNGTHDLARCRLRNTCRN